MWESSSYPVNHCIASIKINASVKCLRIKSLADRFPCVEEMAELFVILLLVVQFSAKVIQIHFLIGVNVLPAVPNQQFLFPGKK